MSGSAIATARHAKAAVCLRQNNEPYQKENCLSKALPGRPHEASRNEKSCLSHRPVLRRPENKKQCPRCPILVTPNTNLYIAYGICELSRTCCVYVSQCGAHSCNGENPEGRWMHASAHGLYLFPTNKTTFIDAPCVSLPYEPKAWQTSSSCTNSPWQPLCAFQGTQSKRRTAQANRQQHCAHT